MEVAQKMTETRIFLIFLSFFLYECFSVKKKLTFREVPVSSATAYI
jgi:hypothetical protein